MTEPYPKPHSPPAEEALAAFSGLLQDELGSDRLLELLWLEPAALLRDLSRNDAARILAAVELARRLARAEVPQRPLDQPQALARYLFLRYARPNQEIVGVVFLDAGEEWIADREIFRGGFLCAVAEPAQILQLALDLGAPKFLLFHTHTSFDPEPSESDFNFTYWVDYSAEELGIELVDHWVLAGPDRWESIMSEGGDDTP